LLPWFDKNKTFVGLTKTKLLKIPLSCSELFFDKNKKIAKEESQSQFH